VPAICAPLHQKTLSCLKPFMKINFTCQYFLKSCAKHNPAIHINLISTFLFCFVACSGNSCCISSVESVRRTRKLQEKRNRYGKYYPLQSHFKQKKERKSTIKFPKYIIHGKLKLVPIQSVQITKHRFLLNTTIIFY